MNVKQAVKYHGDYWHLYVDAPIKRNYIEAAMTPDFADYTLMKFWLQDFFQHQKAHGFYFKED